MNTLINDAIDYDTKFDTVNSLESLINTIFNAEELARIHKDNEKFFDVLGANDTVLFLANFAINSLSYDDRLRNVMRFDGQNFSPEKLRKYFDLQMRAAEKFFEFKKPYDAVRACKSEKPWLLQTDVEGSFNGMGVLHDAWCSSAVEYAAVVSSYTLWTDEVSLGFDADEIDPKSVERAIVLIDIMREHMSPEELKHMIPEVCYVASDELPAKIHDIYVAL